MAFFPYLLILVFGEAIYNNIPDEGALAICDALENRKQHLEYFYLCKIAKLIKTL